MNLIFENEYFKLGHEPELSIVLLKWKDFQSISFEDYKIPFEKALEFQKNVSVDNFLTDVRIQGVIAPGFRKWFQDYPLQASIEQGLKRTAIVSSANVFKKYYLNHIFNSSEKLGLPMKIFNTYEEALVWIKSFYKKI